MASEEATCQQPEVALVLPEEVLEEKVMTVSTDNAAVPTNISILHDYAMDHLFSFLSMADLKNCRLVNRSWNRISNQAIKKRKYVINFEVGQGFRPIPGYKLQDIPKLDQLIRSSFEFPWTKFNVRGYFLSSAEDNRGFGDLLPVINPFVTELEIFNLQSLQSLEYPNLRKLTLEYNFSKTAPSGSNWKSLLRMIETASNLNEIAILGKVHTPSFMDVLEIQNCRKITRLSLSRWIKGEELVRLSKIGLQLKFLSLDFDLFDTTAESVRAVLQSQSNCLEQLELTCEDYFPNPENDDEEDDEVNPGWLLGMEFPVMEKLKILSVRSENMYSLISYKDMFPALKKLNVCSDDDIHPLDDSFFSHAIEPVETVECLRLGVWPRCPETILLAAKQFPKLRNVSLVVSQNLLNTVGHAMPQLEAMELAFYREDNVDSILTGLFSQEVDTLKGLPASELDAVERNKGPVHFLKNLKMLRLSSRAGRTVVTSLSDFGCRFALLKMEHLQVLELRGNFSNISAEVMERMRKKFVVRLEN